MLSRQELACSQPASVSGASGTSSPVALCSASPWRSSSTRWVGSSSLDDAEDADTSDEHTDDADGLSSATSGLQGRHALKGELGRHALKGEPIAQPAGPDC